MAQSSIIGTAGEYYVAYKLSCLGYVVALPRAGSPMIDIMVSNVNGSKTIGIQVKTTDFAIRTKGRGKNKVPFQLQFPLGAKAGKKEPSSSLIYAFVDLNGSINHENQPDIYFLTSQYVYDYCKDWVNDVSMVRFHVAIEEMDKFKNNYEFVHSQF